MRFIIFVLALLLYHTQWLPGACAHPSTQQQQHENIARSVIATDDISNGGGSGSSGRAASDGYFIANTYKLYPPQHQQQQQQQQKQQAKEKPLMASYGSTDGPFSTASSPSYSYSSSSSPHPDSSDAGNTAPVSMQPTFVYEAKPPLHVEPDRYTSPTSGNNTEHDGESSKKIIGSSVVTSVSVILNGNEPQFTDALGHKVPKPQPSLQVASPINLLNPDRYEFYTFDDNGELVKRLMTMQEIQSIVANGDGEGPSIIHTAPIHDRDPEKNVQDIVHSVQSVLNKEVESTKNSTSESLPVLDTPDVSSSWSMILPAIFGNTGGDIFPQQKPQQIVMTPESEILETSTRVPPSSPPTTKKTKPSKRKPGQKRKPTRTSTTTTTTTTEITPQVVQEELDPHESVYTGIHQYQNMGTNLEDFEGFSQLHGQPIYQKVSESPQESTTRRVFINNQEYIETSDPKKPTNVSDLNVNEYLGKKPVGVAQKHTPPHRIKLPNRGQNNTRPLAGHTKQKIKKRPTSTTTTTSAPTTVAAPPSTTAATTTTPAPTTTTAAPTTTTTTTTPSPTTTPAPVTTPEPDSTTAAVPVPLTTPKKKRKKPTRHPGHPAGTVADADTTAQNGTQSRPHLTGDKRKPGARPGPHHKPRPTPTAQQEVPPYASGPHKQRPRPHKPRPSAATTTSTTSTTTTTTTTTTAAPTTTTTTTSTTTTPPPTSASTAASTSTSGLISEDFPGIGTLNGLPLVQPGSPEVIPSSTPLVIPNEPSLTTTHRPSFANAPGGYPYPIHSLSQQLLPPQLTDIIAEYNMEQLKKDQLPSLSMIQKHHQQSKKPPSSTHKPITLEEQQDLDTFSSYEQIMQSLKEESIDRVDDASVKDTTKKPSTLPSKVPVKYDSAETAEELEQIADKKKQPIAMNAPGSTVSTTALPPTTTPIVQSSPASTLIVNDNIEPVNTGKPIYGHPTTDGSTEESTLSGEDNSPVVIITARPQYFVTTKQPEMSTNSPMRDELETTEDSTEQTAAYPQMVFATDMESMMEADEETSTSSESSSSTTIRPSEASEDQSHVVKFEPLYADVQEPVIKEIPTTTRAPPQTDDSTMAYADMLQETTTITPIEELIDTTESSDDDGLTSSTQGQPKLPVTLPQKVENIIANSSEDSTEVPPLVADLKPLLNLGVLKPSGEITMADFQTQAATVASILVDGTNTLAADNFMSSNETKDELDFLISDVIHQITGESGYNTEMTTNNEPVANRLSGFAQLNSSLAALLKPTRGETKPDQISAVTEPMRVSTTEMPHKLSPSPEEEHKESDITSMEEMQKIDESYTAANKLQVQTPTTTQATPLSFEEMEVETTTFRIPILSLSQIYAQQQQEEEEKEALYEAEHHKVVYIDGSGEGDWHKMENSYPTSAEAMATATEDMHKHVQEDASETTAENNKTEKTEEENTETVEIEKTSDEKSEPSKEESSVTMTPLASDESSYDQSSSGYQSLSERETTVAPVENSESTESTDVSSINVGFSESLKDSTAESATEVSTEQIDSTKEKDASEDSQTNSANVELQYTKQPSGEENTSVSQEEKTEIPTDVEITDITEPPPETDNSSVISDEITEPPTEIAFLTPGDQEFMAEVSEANSEELNAIISEEDDTDDVLVVDPYIKLGETTTKASMEQQHTEQQQETDQPSENVTVEEENSSMTVENLEKSAEKEDIMKPAPVDDEEHEEQTPPLPIESVQEQQKQEEIADNDEPAPLPALTNYGTSPDHPDQQEEAQDLGYQAQLSQPLGLLATNRRPAPTTSSTSTTSSTTTTTTTTSTSTPRPSSTTTTKRLNTLKPVSYYKQPAFGVYNQQAEPPKVMTYTASSSQQRPMQRPPALSNLMATSTQATRPPVDMKPSPADNKGLEASLANLDEDVLSFARLCNELAFSYWKSITSEKISSARSLVMSPFALTSMLSMVFLGARGSTSGEMNEVLKLDDMVTFNPHLVFKNVTDSVERASDSDIATVAFVREIFSDRGNGKILQFFKEKTQQFYAGHVEEVNFHVVNDIIRRRTNLLVKRHTMGKVLEYLRTNSVWVNGPLATISANLFQTDCSRGSTHDRDGEMFFQVHPTVRQRRLVPIPAVLYRSGFTAGYEPKLDATVAAFGRIQDSVSTIYVMPGQQSAVSPTDSLDRLEREMADNAFKENGWSNILTSLMDRPGMEVQLPRFSHRSFVNASLGLQKMGLKGLFKSEFADLRGLTGSSNREVFLSDMIQINTFSTCGEERISDNHHVEMYPAPPLRKRNKDMDVNDDDALDSSEVVIDFGSLVQDSALTGRGFYDDLLDPKYLELPLPLRPRQARVPDAPPRLRFDKPFLYFVRHNPTGMILFMGRFNPRLLP